MSGGLQQLDRFTTLYFAADNCASAEKFRREALEALHDVRHWSERIHQAQQGAG